MRQQDRRARPTDRPHLVPRMLLLALVMLVPLLAASRPTEARSGPVAASHTPRIVINGRPAGRSAVLAQDGPEASAAPAVPAAQIDPTPTREPRVIEPVVTEPVATAPPPPEPTAIVPTPTRLPIVTAPPVPTDVPVAEETRTPRPSDSPGAVPTEDPADSPSPSASPSDEASPSPSPSRRTARSLVTAQSATAGRLTLGDATPNDRPVPPGQSTTFRHAVSISCPTLGCVIGVNYDVTLSVTATGIPVNAQTITVAKVGGSAITPSGTNYATQFGCALLGGVLGCGGEFDVTVTVPAGTTLPYTAVVTVGAKLTSENVTPATVTDRLTGSPSVTLTITTAAAPSTSVNFGTISINGRTSGTNAAVTVQDGLLGPTFVYPGAVTVSVTSNVAWSGTCRIAAGTQTGSFPTVDRVQWRVSGTTSLQTFPPTSATATRDACFPATNAGTFTYTYDLAIVTLITDPAGTVNAQITYRVSQ